MKQALWMGLLIIVVLGCGKQQPQETVKGPTGGGGSNSGNPNTDDKVTNQTETSICDQPFSGKPSVMGTWFVDLLIKGVAVHQSLTFSPGKVRNRAVCQPEGLSLVAEALSPGLYTAGLIQVLQTTETTTVSSDGRFKCTAPLAQGTMSYTFNGPCLKLSGFQDYLWVPENLNDETIQNQDEETPWENSY